MGFNSGFKGLMYLMFLLCRHGLGRNRKWMYGTYTVTPFRTAADLHVRSAATFTTDTSCQ